MAGHARSLRSVPLSILLLAGIWQAAVAADQAPPAALQANPVATGPTAQSTEASIAEMIRSYLSLRDQVHSLQMSILQQRLEAEVMARTQATLVAEKLDAIRTTLDAERESRRQESLRAQAERDRLSLELAGFQRTVLWVAAGLVALGLTAAATRHYLEAGRARSPALPKPAVPAAPPEPPGAAQLPRPGVAAPAPAAPEPIRPSPPPPTPQAEGQVMPAPKPPSRFPDRDPLEQLRRDPAWIAGLLSQGNSLLMDNRAREALSCFEELLQFDPANGDAWVKRGLALERLQQFDSAMRSYDQAIALEPGLSAAHLHRAGLCTRLRRFDDAAESYRRAAQGNAPLSAANR